MFLDLAIEWKKQFEEKTPREKLSGTEFGSVCGFAMWLDARNPTPRGADKSIQAALLEDVPPGKYTVEWLDKDTIVLNPPPS